MYNFYFVIIKWYEFTTTSYSFLFFILRLQKQSTKKENKLDKPQYNFDDVIPVMTTRKYSRYESKYYDFKLEISQPWRK